MPSSESNAIGGVQDIPGLVALWTFQESAGASRVSSGPVSCMAEERNGKVARIEPAGGGVFGASVAHFRPDGGYLVAPRLANPTLDIHGPKAQVSVVAWIRREPSPLAEQTICQAVAGVWNEHAKRQYCLFLNLRIHESTEQVGAHVSAIGGATPGFKYCMDAAIGATPVPMERWQCVGMTYDGNWARAYIEGRLDVRGDRNPYRYEGGLFDGGPTGADFTIGAVTRPARVDETHREHGSIVGNRFYGLLGGLAIFRRALSEDEMRRLASLTPR